MRRQNVLFVYLFTACDETSSVRGEEGGDCRGGGGGGGGRNTAHHISCWISLIIRIKIPLCARKSPLTLKAGRDFLFFFFLEIRQTCSLPLLPPLPPPLSSGSELNPDIDGELHFLNFLFITWITVSSKIPRGGQQKMLTLKVKVHERYAVFLSWRVDGFASLTLLGMPFDLKYCRSENSVLKCVKVALTLVT